MSVLQLLKEKAAISRADHGGDHVEFGGRLLTLHKRVNQMNEEEAIRVADMLGMDTKTGKARKKAEMIGTTHIEPKECECGCGGYASGPNRKFLPGHDMKLKARLRKAAQDGDKSAETELKKRNW